MVKFIKNKDTGEVIMVDEKEVLKDNEVELKANSTDAAFEKHLPVIKIDGDKVHVTVSSVIHPMSEAHHISFIALVTDRKAQLKKLSPTQTPEADFALEPGEKVLKAFEFCNLHGLWVTNA